MRETLIKRRADRDLERNNRAVNSLIHIGKLDSPDEPLAHPYGRWNVVANTTPRVPAVNCNFESHNSQDLIIVFRPGIGDSPRASTGSFPACVY